MAVVSAGSGSSAGGGGSVLPSPIADVVGGAGDALVQVKRSFMSWAVRHGRDSGASGRVFGVSLEQTCQHENSQVPLVVFALVAHLRQPSALRTEGIYRLSGRAEAVRRLRAAFDSGCDSSRVDLSSFAHHDIASALQLYVRELPEPLMTYEVYERIVRFFPGELRDDLRLRAVLDVMRTMPECNRKVLNVLLDAMVDASDLADVNQMNESNLATVWAPNVFRPRPVEGADSTMAFLVWLQHSPMMMSCVRLLIFNRRKETNRLSVELGSFEAALSSQQCALEKSENEHLLMSFVDSYTSQAKGFSRHGAAARHKAAVARAAAVARPSSVLPVAPAQPTDPAPVMPEPEAISPRSCSLPAVSSPDFLSELPPASGEGHIAPRFDAAENDNSGDRDNVQRLSSSSTPSSSLSSSPPLFSAGDAYSSDDETAAFVALHPEDAEMIAIVEGMMSSFQRSWKQHQRESLRMSALKLGAEDPEYNKM